MPESTTPRTPRRSTGLKNSGPKKAAAPAMNKAATPATPSAARDGNANAWPFNTLTVSDAAPEKKAARVETVAPSEAEREEAARTAAARRQAGSPVTESRRTQPIDLDKPDMGRMIAEAAYYHAERRGFRPGYELEDWVAAECEVNLKLAQLRKAAGKNLIG
jgi:hypothetical protein